DAEELPASEVNWEQENNYQLSSGTYSLKFDEGPDPVMKLVVVPEEKRYLHEVKELISGECKKTSGKDTITPGKTCYSLGLKQAPTSFGLKIGEAGEYAVFSQHRMKEFNARITGNNDQEVPPKHRLIPGKGDWIGTSIKSVQVKGLQPPFDDMLHGLLTLLFVTGLGFLVGRYAKKYQAT
ncbi:MAG: hypothetical protein ABEJ65_01160, partial [bacterium]